MSAANDLIGQSIGRYTITERLGQGGMALVYRAYDTRLDCDVAVKFIRRDAIAAEVFNHVLERFEREAKALAQLTHPNIVKVTDYGEHEALPYLVMPFIPGGTLKDRCGKPVEYHAAARLLLPIARALEYAHRRGVLHRDVKPSNILVTESGEPLLCDFGIAKLLEASDGRTLTGTGVGIGTPEYMAPEQGMGDKVDGRADIYSLGVVFYELVTGRKPYTADTPMAVVLKHISDPLPLPRRFNPALPEEVERLLLTALAKNPEDRYADMAAFALALERLEREGPGSMAQPRPALAETAPDRPAQPPEPRPPAEYGAAQPPVVAKQPAVEKPAAEKAPAARPAQPRLPSQEVETSTSMPKKEPARKASYPARRAGFPARRAFAWSGGALVLVALLAALAWWAISSLLGGGGPSAAITQAAPTLGAVAGVPGNPTPASPQPSPSAAPASSPTVEAPTLAPPVTPATAHGLISAKNAASVQMLTEWQGEPAHDAAYSPDWRTVAVASAHGIFLYQAGDFQMIRRIDTASWVYSVAFSPDGRLLASGTEDKKLQLWQVADGSLQQTLAGFTGDVLCVTFSPDGQHVAAGSTDNTVRVWRVADGAAELTLHGHSKYVWSVAFSPDSKWLASGSLDGTVLVWQVSDGALQNTLTGHKDGVTSVVYSPDGKLLASASYDRTIRLWNTIDGSLERALAGHTDNVRVVRFSPDGSLVASGATDRTVRLWQVDDGSLVQTLEGHSTDITSLVFSPDGTRLASASLDGILRLWGAP